MGLTETKIELIMTDVILESVRALVLLGIVIVLWNKGRSSFELTRKGWNYIIAGFGLHFIGSLVDITDNFEELNRFVIIGDTPAEAFLVSFVCYLGGFALLAVGLLRWIPQELAERKRAQDFLVAAIEGWPENAKHDATDWTRAELLVALEELQDGDDTPISELTAIELMERTAATLICAEERTASSIIPVVDKEPGER